MTGKSSTGSSPEEQTPDQACALVNGFARETESETSGQRTDATNARPWRIDWATLLRRIYDVDVLRCPCGGRLRFVEVIVGPQASKTLIELEKFSGTHISNQTVPSAPPVLDGWLATH